MKTSFSSLRAGVLSSVFCLLLLAGFMSRAGAQPSDALPPELSGLASLTGDEKKLMEAVRQFDIHQTGLAVWDQDLAELYAKQGDRTLAQERLKKSQERIALVRRAYEEALKHYPNSVFAKTYYAETLYDYPETPAEQGRAVQLWQEVVQADPAFGDAWNNLAIFYSHSGSYKECFDAMDKALALEPDNPDYLFNAAQFYLVHTPQAQEIYGWSNEEIYRKAMDASRKAAEIRSDSYPLLQDYATNFYRGEQLGVPVDWKEAAQAWEKARGRARNIDELFYSWLNEGRAWLRAGNKEKARETLEAALRLNPQSEPTKRLLEQAKG